MRSRLWFHVAGSYILSLITMHFLSRECMAYAKLRHRHLASNSIALHTILVERIPSELRCPARLTAYFSKMYVGSPCMPHTGTGKEQARSQQRKQKSSCRKRKEMYEKKGEWWVGGKVCRVGKRRGTGPNMAWMRCLLSLSPPQVSWKRALRALVPRCNGAGAAHQPP